MKEILWALSFSVIIQFGLNKNIDRKGKVVVCYIGSWAVYRPERGAFSTENIDTNLCTHLIYSFAGLDPTTSKIKSLDPYNDLQENYGKGNYMKMTALKSRGVKVLLAIGGWNEGSSRYSNMSADPDKRAIFTTSVVSFIKEYNFDGFDLDWEFPTERGGSPEDRENFVYLAKELKTALGKEGLLFTAAISASVRILSQGYDLERLHNHLDLLHIMCYDYHGNWENKTGAHSPLGPSKDPLTIESTIKYILDKGVPAEKVVLGLPAYGKVFILSSQNTSGSLGEQSKLNEGFQGPFTRTDGFLGYNEICMNTSKWVSHWDDASSTPWASSSNKVVVYDDPKSLKLKIDFVLKKNLAGVLVWSIDTDDFRGDCAPSDPNGSYPLLRAINKALTEGPTMPKVRDEKGGSCSTIASSSLVFTLLILFFLQSR